MATYSLMFGYAEALDDTGPERAAPAAPRTERLTVRLPAPLRRRIASSAARSGLSADEWAARVLARALDGSPTATTR